MSSSVCSTTVSELPSEAAARDENAYVTLADFSYDFQDLLLLPER
jgi:hypothetical protein